MWATLTPEILARFPRHPLNGAINGVHASSGTTPQGDWDARIAELEVFRTYTDDWDGQGSAGLAAPAAAIGGELVDSAVTLAKSGKVHGRVTDHEPEGSRRTTSSAMRPSRKQ